MGVQLKALIFIGFALHEVVAFCSEMQRLPLPANVTILNHEQEPFSAPGEQLKVT